MPPATGGDGREAVTRVSRRRRALQEAKCPAVQRQHIFFIFLDGKEPRTAPGFACQPLKPGTAACHAQDRAEISEQHLVALAVPTQPEYPCPQNHERFCRAKPLMPALRATVSPHGPRQQHVRIGRNEGGLDRRNFGLHCPGKPLDQMPGRLAMFLAQAALAPGKVELRLDTEVAKQFRPVHLVTRGNPGNPGIKAFTRLRTYPKCERLRIDIDSKIDHPAVYCGSSSAASRGSANSTRLRPSRRAPL